MAWTAASEASSNAERQGLLQRTVNITYELKTPIVTIDYFIQSSNAVYATAREGGSIQLTRSSTASTRPLHRIGQRFSSGNFRCYIAMLEFDTSVIPEGSVISTATLNFIELNGKPSLDFIIEVRQNDWGGHPPTVEDWVPGSELGDYALVASMDTADWPDAEERIDFVSEDALIDAVNLDGFSRFMLNSSRHRLGNEVSLGTMGEEIWIGNRTEVEEESALLTIEAIVPTTEVPYEVQSEASPGWSIAT